MPAVRSLGGDGRLRLAEKVGGTPEPLPGILPAAVLGLPDYIGPYLNADERSTIGEHVNTLTFSRMVLIQPRDPTKALVLTQSKAVPSPSS